MVSEAVSELKGEPRPRPVELSLDLPDAAHLPASYVAAEDVRLEAYRRLASVQTKAEVSDVRAEWEDRFGPLPAPARALLDVARLRVECVRLGITDVAVALPRPGMGSGVRAAGGGAAGGGAVRGRAGGGGGGPRATVKMSPISLPASAEVRLRRLAPGATYQPDLHRLLLPMALPGEGSEFAPDLVDLLTGLMPADQ
jgi:transcription-repair coupling factor (superfamily II helicase)